MALGYVNAALHTFLRFVHATNTAANDIATYNHTFTGTYIKYFPKVQSPEKKASCYVVSEIKPVLDY